METHVKLQSPCLYLECKNIFIILESIVVVTFFTIIPRYGYDQSNMSYKKYANEKHAKPQKAVKNIEKLKDLIFILNDEITSWDLVMMEVTYVDIITNFGNNQIKIIYNI